MVQSVSPVKEEAGLYVKSGPLGEFPGIQGLGLGIFSVRGQGLIPGPGTKIPQSL